MRGCMPVYPKENHTSKNKSPYHNATPETRPTDEKNETKNPPGVFMPPETEMSPPQLG